MTKRSKRDKRPSLLKAILAANVCELRDQKYRSPSYPDETARNKALAKAADTSLSTIQRVCKGEVATGIDIVEALARVFEMDPRDLLTNFIATSSANGMAHTGTRPQAQ